MRRLVRRLRGFRSDDFLAGVGVRFALSANAHLSNDETVAKMGHPAFVMVPGIHDDIGRQGFLK
jgi:hypothetical protein